MNHKLKNTPIILLILVLIFFFNTAAIVLAEENDTKEQISIDSVLKLLNNQNNDISKELRQIKREIMSLKSVLDKPRLTEILGGIGYILGIFGIAFYVYAKKTLNENSQRKL
ncbi:MAG: hypothetical protein HQK76_17440 [Desulfobacterales bacterium]|nr:hypothetical protein [Desulfobacterales bacterium]